jgi:hypothetical protein
MPLHSKRAKRGTKRSTHHRAKRIKSRHHKGILRSGKRITHKKRGHRVRFVGGMVGDVWMDTPIGPMKKKEYEQYQQRLSPEAY